LKKRNSAFVSAEHWQDQQHRLLEGHANFKRHEAITRPTYYPSKTIPVTQVTQFVVAACKIQHCRLPTAPVRCHPFSSKSGLDSVRNLSMQDEYCTAQSHPWGGSKHLELPDEDQAHCLLGHWQMMGRRPDMWLLHVAAQRRDLNPETRIYITGHGLPSAVSSILHLPFTNFPPKGGPPKLRKRPLRVFMLYECKSPKRPTSARRKWCVICVMSPFGKHVHLADTIALPCPAPPCPALGWPCPPDPVPVPTSHTLLCSLL
jgi:hypothetical protein